METIKLSNGVDMPILGYGVYQVSPSECERCVSDAISVGYRLIDTAQAYFNEEGVGNAIKKCGVPRNELFIVTKVWISNAGYERAKASIEESLRKLQTDYIDLLLIHQPFGDYYGTYRAMEEAYRAGKLRAIGVSNFYPDRLIDIAEFSEIPPDGQSGRDTRIQPANRSTEDYAGVWHSDYVVGTIRRRKKQLFRKRYADSHRSQVRKESASSGVALPYPARCGGYS